MKKCKSCWWQEGGKCYVEENKVTICITKCDKYCNKREALTTVISTDKLIIISENTDLL